MPSDIADKIVNGMARMIADNVIGNGGLSGIITSLAPLRDIIGGLEKIAEPSCGPAHAAATSNSATSPHRTTPHSGGATML